MSKGIYKPTSRELLDDLLSIAEINERLNDLDVVRLKELLIYLNKMIFEKFSFINEFLILNPTYNLDYATNHITQYGLSYNNLEELKEIIQVRISFLTHKKINDFNGLIFKDKQSEMFFTYLVENWLKEEVNNVTALQYIFTQMWYKNTESETSFKIKCTMPYFAREYWNGIYYDILKLHPKNPKLNNPNITNEYYSKRFLKHLNEFTGV